MQKNIMPDSNTHTSFLTTQRKFFIYAIIAAKQIYIRSAVKNAAAAQKAQSTADRAVADAAKAQAKADAAYAPDQPPYVVGAYTGSGSSLTVTLGFRPKFVIATSGDFDTSTICVGMQTGSDHLRITDSGFTVSRITYGGGTLTGEYKPHMCTAGTTYNYIAFR